MDEIKVALKAAAQRYNTRLPHHEQCRLLSCLARTKLEREATYAFYGNYTGRPPVPYHTFSIGQIVSRPVRPDLLINAADFQAAYQEMEARLTTPGQRWLSSDEELATSVVYTAVMSVACCYDLWQRGSRKTPGTFFEVIMASFLQLLAPRLTFSKHVPLAALLADGTTVEEDAEAAADDSGSSVATDLVLTGEGSNFGIVIPLKITTRERIVQPFAHQRILNSAFGEEAFRSLIACISETQLDALTHTVKQVCVPGTVKLYQRHLAAISALYYCDIPQRYAAPDMIAIIPVKTLGSIFPDVERIFGL